jgi:hypothetical protein
MVFAGRFAFRVGFAHSAMPSCRAPSMDAQPADRGRASGACATIDRGAVATGRDRFRGDLPRAVATEIINQGCGTCED